MASARQDINYGKPLASCDCCEKLAVLHRADYHQIETYACAECSGGTLCPKCLDDADYCECQEMPELGAPR